MSNTLTPESHYPISNNSDYDDWLNVLPKHAGPQRDISAEAVWSLSSCKVVNGLEGFGINQLLEERTDNFWQSDGPQPHTITIEFQQYTEISFLLLYLDYKSDESYTPQNIQVYTGSSILDLEEPPSNVSFAEPNGWQFVDLRQNKRSCVRTFVVQVHVLQNHTNGRDTHIRACKVLGPQCNDENVELTSRDLVKAFKNNDIILEHTLR